MNNIFFIKNISKINNIFNLKYNIEIFSKTFIKIINLKVMILN